MSGTNHTREAAGGPVRDEGPVVILVRPQLGENIGTAARAMLNTGLERLRLVAPRDPWPNERATAAASGADRVLLRATVYGRTEEAIADLTAVYATTARPRDMVKPVLTPRQAALGMAEMPEGAARAGILFGPERSGLDNEDVVLADTIIAAPLNPAFSSLNLAQAVLLVGYEWYQAAGATRMPSPAGATEAPATKHHLLGLFEHLEQELDASGFFHPKEKRPGMVRNLRNVLQRAGMTEHEVRTLHGVVTALSGRRLGGKPRGRG